MCLIISKAATVSLRKLRRSFPITIKVWKVLTINPIHEQKPGYNKAHIKGFNLVSPHRAFIWKPGIHQTPDILAKKSSTRNVNEGLHFCLTREEAVRQSNSSHHIIGEFEGKLEDIIAVGTGSGYSSARNNQITFKRIVLSKEQYEKILREGKAQLKLRKPEYFVKPVKIKNTKK